MPYPARSYNSKTADMDVGAVAKSIPRRCDVYKSPVALPLNVELRGIMLLHGDKPKCRLPRLAARIVLCIGI